MSSELTWLDTRELAHLIRAGEVSAVEAVEDHLARIDEVNPELNAVVTLDAERALARASTADRARAAGDDLGPLHGVPMTHKDTHATAGMRTTWGSPVFADTVPTKDALIVARLAAAGVIATGKTNVPEFAAGSHTFNPVFGTTVNPYDTSRSAAGSSGGVGAVVAAGVQASGDGSDMGGSLRTPGSFNNVVGFRPSDGRIPKTTAGDPWAWLAQEGFMARTVGDVALLLQVTAGPHPDSPTGRPEPGTIFDLPEFRLDASYEPDLTGIRIGFSPDLGGRVELEHAVREVVAASSEAFAGLGARLDDACPDLDAADGVFSVQRGYDFVLNWGGVVGRHREQIKPDVIWNVELGLGLTTEDLVRKDRARARLQAAIQRFFGAHDVLVCTTSQVLPFDAALEYPTEINGVAVETYLDWMRAATLISATGCPAVSVPAGFSPDGLPVGIQLVAAPGKDVELLRVAHAFEAVTGHHLRHPAL